MVDEPVGDEDDGRDALVDGVEHLQAAAREVIKAGRSLLDAAEGLIEDPQALQGLVGTLGSLAQAAVRGLGNVAAGSGSGNGSDDGDDGKVQRIRVS